MNSAGIEDKHSNRIMWGVGQYSKHGVANWLVQIPVVLLAMLIVM